MSDTSPQEPEKGRRYKFYPNHLFIEAVTAIVVLLILVVLALLWQIPLEEKALPSDTTYVPRPEWYFLFYFQLLKYFEGALTVVGIFFLPLAVFLLLLFLPFFDRKPATRLVKRPFAVLSAALGLFLVVGLTVQALGDDSEHPKIRHMSLPPFTAEDVEEGKRMFNTFCVLCHSMDGKGGFMAPDLTQIGGRAGRTYIENVVIDPQIVSRKTIMSLIPLSDEERHKVSAFLSTKQE